MQSDDKHPISHFISPIEASIRDLELVCRIVRPFPSALEPSSLSNAEKSTVNLPSSFFELAASSSSMMLQQLLEFTSADLDLKHLVWCVYEAHYKSVPKKKVLAFLQALDDWKTYNTATFQMLKMEDSLSDPIDFSYQALSKLPFPPACHAKSFPGVLPCYSTILLLQGTSSLGIMSFRRPRQPDRTRYILPCLSTPAVHKNSFDNLAPIFIRCHATV